MARDRRAHLALAVVAIAAAVAAAALVPWPVFDDPSPDICGTWHFMFIAVAWFAGVPALVLALASLKWRSLRAFAVAIVLGAVVGSAVGAVIAQRELRELKADPRGYYCD